MKRFTAALLFVVCPALASTSDAGAPIAVGRASACRTVLEPICKLYIGCQRHHWLDGEAYRDFADCVRVDGDAYCGPHHRPQRDLVDAQSFNACFSAVKGIKLTEESCANLFDEGNPPDVCRERFLPQVWADDYEATTCGPEYKSDRGTCRITLRDGLRMLARGALLARRLHLEQLRLSSVHERCNAR